MRRHARPCASVRVHVVQCAPMHLLAGPKMSVQIFRVSVLFIAQNYGRIKMSSCSLINLFQKTNMRIINKLMQVLHNTK